MPKFKYDAKTKTGNIVFNGHSKKEDVVKTIEVNHVSVFVNLSDDGMPVGIELLHLGCLGNKSFEIGE
jgi:uncharacterized protein YuzE